MNYTVTLADGTQARHTATVVNLAPNGALMFADGPNSFTVMYAPTAWTKVEVSAIQNAN